MTQIRYFLQPTIKCQKTDQGQSSMEMAVFFLLNTNGFPFLQYKDTIRISYEEV